MSVLRGAALPPVRLGRFLQFDMETFQLWIKVYKKQLPLRTEGILAVLSASRERLSQYLSETKLFHKLQIQSNSVRLRDFKLIEKNGISFIIQEPLKLSRFRTRLSVCGHVSAPKSSDGYRHSKCETH
jgi:hypothetical protein